MRSERPPTPLRPEPFRPGRALPLSILGHAALFLGVWVFSTRAPEASVLIDPDEVMEVRMVSLPQPKAAIPQKAQRQPPPPPPRRTTPVPEALATPEAEPLEEAPAEPQADLERQARREDLLRQMQREALLENLRNAPEGPVDQAATTSTGDLDADGSAEQGIGDLERARYSEEVRRVFYRDFNPLQDDPALTTLAWVWIDDTGRILRHEIKTPSGDGSFDAAVERAIRLVDGVPVPPEGLVVNGALRLDLVFRTVDQ